MQSCNVIAQSSSRLYSPRTSVEDIARAAEDDLALIQG
jgi:hypothetical protein